MKKQEKTKLVKEIIGEYLEEKGFQYKGYNSDMQGWKYEREEGDVIQFIIVDEYVGGLRLALIVNAAPVYGKDFIPEDEYKGNILGFWEYSNQDEFVSILKTYVKALENKGMEILNKISQPSTEIGPTPEMNRELYDNHTSLAEKYRLKLGISKKQTEPTEAAKLIQKEIEKLHSKTFEEATSDLIGLAAVCGEVMRECLGGEWEWNKVNKGARIQLPKCVMYPLISTVYSWGGKSNIVEKQMLGDYRYHKISLY